jgi:hypothetical protein
LQVDERADPDACRDGETRVSHNAHSGNFLFSDVHVLYVLLLEDV